MSTWHYLEGAWDPRALAGSSSGGAWYDPSDTSAMFVGLDGSGGHPGAGDPVGMILDKSGNDFHMVAPTDDARPILMLDGVSSFLRFDGIDDELAAPTGGAGLSDCSIFIAVRSTDTITVLFGRQPTNVGIWIPDNVSLTHAVSGTPKDWVDGQIVSPPNRGGLYSALADDEWHIYEIRNCDLSLWAIWGVSAYLHPNWRFGGDVVGPIIIPTGPELTTARDEFVIPYLREQTIDNPAPDGGVGIAWSCPTDLAVSALDTRDAESDPEESDLTDQIVTLLPQGAAWGTPDGEAHNTASEMATFWRGLAKVLKPLYSHGFTTALESTVSTISNSLEDWEREFGLPDSCFGSDQTFETRLRAVVWKDLSPATITPGDYLCLANRLDYDIRIEEPESFEAGLSECGLDHETATTNLEVEWVIHLVTGPTEYFHSGTSEASETRLLDYPENTELGCVFRPLRPAWSLLYFNYTE